MLHAPWTPHTDPNPTHPTLSGFRIRDARGFVVAEIFNRPYPVVVDRAHANALAAVPDMLAALRLAKPVCADAYYDALAVQENPTGDAVNYPAENAQATAAALAAWEAVNAAVALAEGREPEPLDVPEADTPHTTDARKFIRGELVEFIGDPRHPYFGKTGTVEVISHGGFFKIDFDGEGLAIIHGASLARPSAGREG